MEFKIGETVRVEKGTAVIVGKIVARVRADDDPRKCIPMGLGYRLTLRGDVAQRDVVSYLVKKDNAQLLWTYGKKVLPSYPAPASPSNSNLPVLHDVRSISSGTMSYLTGFTRYEDLDRIQRQFVQHVIVTDPAVHYQNWIDAWRWFVNSHAPELPAYADPEDQAFTLAYPGTPTPDAIAATMAEYIPCTAPVGEEQDMRPGNHAGGLIRVGYVRKHWLTARAAEAFARWAREQGVATASNRSKN